MYKDKYDCFFSLSVVHGRPCVFNNTTKSTMLQSGGVGAPGSTTDALFVIHSFSHTHTHTFTLSHSITAFIVFFTEMASATGNRLLIHTAVFSTFEQNDANHTSVLRQIIRTIVIDN